MSPGELLEVYPFFKETYTRETGDLNEIFFITRTNAVAKMLKCCRQVEHVLDKLELLATLSPHLARLRHETQKPRNEFFCATLGDCHAGNIAISNTEKDVIFFDFDIIRFSSPLIDFHHFTAGSLSCRGSDKVKLVNQLLKLYMESFVQTAATLNCNINSSQLLAEYNITKPWFTITSYFVTLLTLEMQGVSQRDEDVFIERINFAKEQEEVKRLVTGMGGPVQTMMDKVLVFLEDVPVDELKVLEKLVMQLALGL